MRRGTFRSDLYYRLNVISIHMPPLRERPDDVELLADRFLRDLGGEDGPLDIDAEAIQRLRAYDWPGNVRELENALERAAVLAGGKTITPDHLPDRVVNPPTASLVDERPADN